MSEECLFTIASAFTGAVPGFFRNQLSIYFSFSRPMKITRTINHGKIRWRINIQKGGFRKRLFFSSEWEAIAFARATGGSFTIETLKTN